MAVVTLREGVVLEGGEAPVFFVTSEEEQERLSFLLSKILRGMIHDLENGVYLIVQH